VYKAAHPGEKTKIRFERRITLVDALRMVSK
jgi:hypothetical protein